MFKVIRVSFVTFWQLNEERVGQFSVECIIKVELCGVSVGDRSSNILNGREEGEDLLAGRLCTQTILKNPRHTVRHAGEMW